MNFHQICENSWKEAVANQPAGKQSGKKITKSNKGNKFLNFTEFCEPASKTDKK